MLTEAHARGLAVPRAVPNAEICVWNSRWKAALLVANSEESRAAVEFSTCIDATGVAFVWVSLLAKSKSLVMVAALTAV